MTSIRDEQIEAAKRRIRAPEGFTPEHMGLSDRGTPLTMAEVMPGGAVVASKADLKMQQEGVPEEDNILAADYEATQIQREAAKQLAEEDQAAAEDQAKADAKQDAADKRAADAEAKKTQPIKIVDDKRDDKPAI